jgi:hypothetical protein
MRTGEVIKPIGSCLISVVVLAVFLTVTAILLKGLTWVSEILAPFLFPAFLLTLLFALILIPFALIRGFPSLEISDAFRRRREARQDNGPGSRCIKKARNSGSMLHLSLRLNDRGSRYINRS